MAESELDSKLFTAMQTGEPLKGYKKTILGRVFCTVLNPFDGKPEGIILFGNPNSNDPSTMVYVWNNAQDVYFRRINKKALETGTIIECKVPEMVKDIIPEPYAAATDEELDVILKSPYMSLLAALNKCKSDVVLNRFLNRARVLEKSEKIIKVIEGRISETQFGEVVSKIEYEK
jgi:hypothetical protein